MIQIRLLKSAATLAALIAATAVLVSQVSIAGDSSIQGDMQSYMAARTAAYATATSFSFGVFSDIHMSEDAGAVLTRAQWAALLTNWRNAGNLFDVIVGDLGYGHLADRDNVLSGPAAVPDAPPVFYAMGNHETDSIGKRSWIDALYPGAVRSTSWSTGPPVPPGNLDHVYWSFNVGATTHFIMLDGDFQTYDTTTRSWQTLGATQYNWLVTDLAANSDKNVLVFVHEPIDQQPTGSWPQLTLNDKGGLLDLLSRHPKKAFVFTGHLHNLGGITKWKGVTSVHVMTGVAPNNGVRVTVNGDTISVTGPGTTTVTDFDANPVNLIESIGGQPVLRVAEDGIYAGNSGGPKMVPVVAENGVVPTTGTSMLRADAVTSYSPRFISESLVKVVPGLHLSYDIYLFGVTDGKDAVAVQPLWYLANDSPPQTILDQNWIALSRHSRNGRAYTLYSDMPSLGGRATSRWYHRDFDLTQMSDGWIDGLYLAQSFNGANIADVYVDNIRFTWPAPGAVVPPMRINVALPVNGGSAAASSTYNANYPAAGVIDGDRRGGSFGAGGAWNDATANSFPDWFEIDFNATKTIDEVDVFSIQDAYSAPIDPTPTMPFTLYGLRDFQIQYWTGTAWTSLIGGTVTGNDLVWRKFTFPALSTSAIRLWITAGLGSYSRLAEVEVYATSASVNVPPVVTVTAPAVGAVFVAPATTSISAAASDADGSIASIAFYANGTLIGTDTTNPYSVPWSNVPAGSYTLTAVATDNLGATTTSSSVAVTINAAATGGRTNVAAASAGATALASSTFSTNYATSGAINGDRRGQPWGANAGWTDATPGAFPDWLEVDFSATQTINEIDVFSVQDSYTAPIDPTPTQTFSLYGLKDFELQYWNGTAWVPVPGGTITSNNLVWRQVTFAPIATSRIRIWITRAGDAYARLTEIEAYTQGSNTAPVVALTAPAGGTVGAAPASLTVSASASDADGSIASVAFYANGTLIASDTTNPYSVPWSNVPAGNYTLTAVATDNLGTTTTSAGVAVTVTVTATGGRTNVAAASAGATAIASSTFSASYAASGAINGDRRGQPWGANAGWNDATPAAFPDWLEVDFSGSQTINEIDVFSVQDSYAAPIDPTPTQTFSLYGLKDFELQYWNGTSWIPVPGSTITNNNLVWRQVTFAPIATSRIRIWVTRAGDAYTRLAEIEAYAAAGNLARTNVAAAGAGATAVASSTFSASYAASGTINGDRRGQPWGANAGWNDATPAAFPDWLEVDFSGTQTINEIDVFSVQDSYASPIDPTPTQTFSLYGLKDFELQYWNGTAWVTIPGSSITANNLVWRQVTFAPISTSRIRIWITRAGDAYSRLTEIEAYTPGG